MRSLIRYLLSKFVKVPEPEPESPRIISSPAVPPSHSGYPRTFQPGTLSENRSQIFDPALRHYSRAFRHGDPYFADPKDTLRWRDARRRATDHVLRAIADSELGERLILRGSRLIHAWCRDAAREPGDLDFVVDPPTLTLGDPWGNRLMEVLTSAVFASPSPEGVTFLRDQIVSDDIWTYERAPGRRFVFPWQAPGLTGGKVQVDVVFGETLIEPALLAAIPVADGECVMIRQASPAQSLAWKLMWLSSDSYPQGKDLYDAVIIAERFQISRQQLDRCLLLVNDQPSSGSAIDLVNSWYVDWENFQTECSWVQGDLQSWRNRLATSLEPTFSNIAVEPKVVSFPKKWLNSDVISLAEVMRNQGAFDLLPILADALQETDCDDDEILLHCRSNGRHSGSCWVVDQILTSNSAT